MLLSGTALPDTTSSAQVRDLGRALFFDVSLSSSGRMSCASCHDPRHAYAAPNSQAIQRGGVDLTQPGIRAVPSLRYILRRTPVWSMESPSDPVEQMLELDSKPVGGFDWDGRFDTLQSQAQSAFLSANQSDNRDAATFARHLAATAHAAEFARIYGSGIFDEPERALASAAAAVVSFELEDPSFQPYSSRFDEFLDGKRRLSPREKRGLKLFVSTRKGNCASCHTATRGADGSHPLFTDFSFQVLGVPRNSDIPANRSADFYDLGLCGPMRTDLVAQAAYCGMFKTPSLRNVATRRVFFHNGQIRSLHDAVRFYVARDRDSDGRYDDLPRAYQGNVDHFDPPFDRDRQAAPALSERDIGDVVAFLRTLTDRNAVAPP